MSNQNNIKVEVVFALKDKQELITISLSNFSTVFDAIKKSKIQEKYPDFDFDSCAVGIWSQVEQLTSILKDGDRVEIYRDLEDDPKEKRRRLALSGKSMSLKK
ncbi:MAG: RnfH family protein [Woeseiaceae bacterium]|jgi:putative ubiquitin-RnfH superfamily antitoxin RatB of RatAB toxin-antitoxin module|nr:RnfH family protein [Woeseiaceae bacterium]MDG1015763.1 RnfH family protein [Woeseiaceae bacterium]MDG1712316.1 RnfH family protein [Woeseiaceae bacterium]MDG1865754.1 RnfH family protein [Woeseiaceae bacterium]